MDHHYNSFGAAIRRSVIILGLFLAFLYSADSFSQCTTGGNYGSFAPNYTGSVQTVSANLSAAYHTVPILANRHYSFLVSDTGSNSNYVGYITITNADATVVYAHGLSPLNWSSGVNTGTIRYYSHADAACSSESTDIKKSLISYTDANFCAAPSGGSETNLVSTSVTLNWDAAPTGPAGGYQYLVTTSFGLPPNDLATTVSGYSMTTSGTYSFLQPDTSYAWYVRSSCGNTTSYWAEGGHFHTPAVICNNPSGLAAVDITSNSFMLTWNAAVPAPANGYEIFVNSNCLTPSSGENITGTSSFYSGVSSSHTYCWWVRSKCVGNTNSGWLFGGTVTPLPVQGCNSASYPVNPAAPFTPAYTGNLETVAANAVAGDFSKINILPYKQYVFTSSVPTDHVTVTDETGNTVLASGLSPITWLSGTGSGSVRYFLHTNATCGISATLRVKFITATSVALPCNAPTVLTAGNISAVGATLSWNVPALVPSNGYQYYYSTGNAAPTVLTTPSGSAVASSAVLSGLSSSTVYYIWVRSDCGNTQSGWFFGGSFTTLAAPTCASPSGLAVSNITSSSALITWNAPGTAPSGGYQVYISAGSATPSVSQTPTASAAENGKLFSGFVSGQTYYFWVRSNCASLQSGWVFGGSFTIPNAFDCNGAALGLYPAATFTPACTGSAEVIATDSYAGEFSKINIQSNKNYTFSSSVGTDVITITNEAGTVLYATGFTPLSWSSGSNSGIIRYFLHANVFCGNEPSNRIRSVSCANAAVCSAPASISANSITSSGVSLYWPDVVPALVGYQYYYSTGSVAPTAATTPSGSSLINSAILSGLNSSTAYYYWVRSNCGSGQSVWIGGSYFTTLAAQSCPLPTNLYANNATDSGVSLHWGTSSVPSNYYDYRYSTSNMPPVAATPPSGNTNNPFITIGALQPGTVYYWWIRSNCGATKSDWASGGSFTTIGGSQAGCTTAVYGQFPDDTFMPSCTGSAQAITVQAWAGEFAKVSLQPNAQYTFTSSVATDYITISDEAGTAILAYGISPLVWDSGSNPEVVRYYLHTNASCGTQNANRTKSISCNMLGEAGLMLTPFRIYPNPVSDILTVTYTGEMDRVEIFNLLGQQVKKLSINAESATIDFSVLPAGTYLLRVYAGEAAQTFKVVRK